MMKASPHWIAQWRADTRYGPVLLVRSTAGLAGLWFEGQAHHPGSLALPVQPHPWFEAALQALERWPSREASLPPLDAQGTDFQRSVWALLRRIPRGEPTQYGALARALGRPTAARAVGAAVGRNPISVLVPCHRVLGRNGGLTGYAGGLALKARLLGDEGSPA